MSEDLIEYGNLAPITTETPENDQLLKELETTPEGLDEIDSHVFRRHLESVQDLMLEHNLDFITSKNFAKNEALRSTIIEINGEIDSLTGLKNRNGLKRALDDLKEIYNRGLKNLEAVFIRADANGLKKINDTHGHKAGDEFLQQFANALKELRSADIIARDGGDEFAIVLLNTNLEGAKSFWKRFNEKLSVDASIVGGATMLDFDNIEESKHIADQIMYESKRRSKEQQMGNCFLTSDDYQFLQSKDNNSSMVIK